MEDKKYAAASFTDDFRARIERERALGGSGDSRGAHFKGKNQSKSKSEDAASLTSSDASQDGAEVMGTWENIKCTTFLVFSLQSSKENVSRVTTNTELNTESRVWFSTKQ